MHVFLSFHAPPQAMPIDDDVPIVVQPEDYRVAQPKALTVFPKQQAFPIFSQPKSIFPKKQSQGIIYQ